MLDGDVNFLGQTKMNLKTQIHKSVLLMYRNVDISVIEHILSPLLKIQYFHQTSVVLILSPKR